MALDNSGATRRAQLLALADLQARQHGLVTLAQAAQLGVTPATIQSEVRAARLRRVRPGVVAATATPRSYEQELCAVVLAAAGSGFAAVSHESAADFVGLPLPRDDRPPFEVTTPLERRSVLDGVRVHRSGHLCDLDVRYYGPIPVTTAARIVVDLSMRLDATSLGRLLDEALRLRLTSLVAVQRCALRLRNAPGRSQARVLRAIRARTGEDESESLLEAFALAALRQFGVRMPEVQYRVRIRGRQRRIDLCYSTEKRAIEPLGYEYHGSRSRFDEDVVRGNELVLAGYVPLYVTSAMTDWEVAVLVAEAIGDPLPARPTRELSFEEWKRTRDAAA